MQLSDHLAAFQATVVKEESTGRAPLRWTTEHHDTVTKWLHVNVAQSGCAEAVDVLEAVHWGWLEVTFASQAAPLL